MKIVFTCASTGGHINPAISIANLVKSKHNDAEILFIGKKNGLENELVKKAGYDILNIRVGKLLRKLALKNVSQMYNAYVGIFDAKKILKEFKPDLVIGTGGYTCVPVMLAAKALKIPYILHESNAYPGLSVKILSKNAKYVLVGFEDTKKRLKSNNIIYSGNPTKFNINDLEILDKEKCLEELKLSSKYIGKSSNLKNRKIVFITGGSQGAKKINETVIEIAKKKDDTVFYVLAVGHNNYDDINKKIQEIKENEIKEIEKYIRVEKYIYDMKIMYKAADICICRAGAMTTIELMIAAKPAILIPLPYATENHQLFNAKIIENLGMAEVIEEKNLSTDKLYISLKEMIKNLKKYILNENKVKNAVKKDVDKIIYKSIIDSIGD